MYICSSPYKHDQQGCGRSFDVVFKPLFFYPLLLIRWSTIFPTRHNTLANINVRIPPRHPLDCFPALQQLLPLPPLLRHPRRRPKHSPLPIRHIPHPDRAFKIPLIDRIICPTPPHQTARKTGPGQRSPYNIRNTAGTLG